VLACEGRCTLGTQLAVGASAQVVQAGQKPPPLSVGRSCVYVCVRADGFVYCGQTDDIRSERFLQSADSRATSKLLMLQL
jgi:hypothetical protein